MDKKTSKIARKWGFPPFVTPKDFFLQTSGSVTFVTVWCPNFLQKLEKLIDGLHIFKREIFKDELTVGWTDQRTGMIA